MSGLAAFFTPDSITFTIDTLVTKDSGFPIRKVGHLSKLNFYPHFKSCVVALGYTRLGLDYHQFINSLVISELVDLVDLTQKYFLDLIDLKGYSEKAYKDGDTSYLGDLYLMGYSDRNNKMCAYIITVRRDSIAVREIRMNVMKYIHPPIKEDDENRIIDEVKNKGGDIPNVLIAIMKQMALDSDNEKTFTVGVGMEIQLVTLKAIEGNFYCSFTTAHRFENFEEDIMSMATNQEAGIIEKIKQKKLKEEEYMEILKAREQLRRLTGLDK